MTAYRANRHSSPSGPAPVPGGQSAGLGDAGAAAGGNRLVYPLSHCLSGIHQFLCQRPVHLQYYLDLFTKSNLKLIGNSLWVATLSSSFTTFFAFCIALYAFWSKEKTRRLLQNGLLLTMISPLFVSALAFYLAVQYSPGSSPRPAGPERQPLRLARHRHLADHRQHLLCHAAPAGLL